MSNKKKKKRSYKQSPEAAVLKEHSRHTPWVVECEVILSMFEPEPYTLPIYVRAPEPTKAMYAARILWGKMIKERGLKPGEAVPEYPKMSDEHHTICLDDSDYLSAWRHAVMADCPRVWFGEQKNPIAFLFFPTKDESLIKLN